MQHIETGNAMRLCHHVLKTTCLARCKDTPLKNLLDSLDRIPILSNTPDTKTDDVEATLNIFLVGAESCENTMSKDLLYKGAVRYMRFHKVSSAIIVYLIFICIIHKIKPSAIYTSDGGFRQFGVGYRNKTVIPMYVVSIILGILCYLAVLFILSIPISSIP
jgi:hypothetical protein